MDDQVQTKRCPQCGEVKPRDTAFRKHRNRNGTLVCAGYCIPCSDAASVAYRRDNRDDINANQKRRYRDNPARTLFHAAKTRAKREGVPFDLKVEDIVIPAVCPVFGFPLVVGDYQSRADSPSLDKVIPPLGYVKGNAFVISWRANDIKKNATAGELEAVAKYIREHSPK